MMIDSLGVGSLVGFLVVIVTVIVSWYIATNKSDWYVPVSWILVSLSLSTMALLSINGLEKAVFGFLITYVALSWIPPLIGFHVGVDALSILLMTSIIALIEFIVVFIARLLDFA